MAKKEKKETRLLTTEYSLHEALAVLKSPLPNPKDGYNASAEGSESFTGTKDLDEANKLATFGSQDILQKIEASADKLSSHFERDAPSFRIVFSPVGSAFSCSRMIKDNPKCMKRRRRTIGASRVVEIMFNITAWCTIESDTMAKRGAAIFTVVRAMEKQGYSVGLTLVTANSRSNGNNTFVRVKEPSEFLDPAVAAYWIAHPSSLRRSFFRLYESLSPELREKYGYERGGGYGRCAEVSESEISKRSEALGAPVLYIPQTDGSHENKTEEQLLEGVLQIFENQGASILKA